MEIQEKHNLKEHLVKFIIYLIVSVLIFSANFYIDLNVFNVGSKKTETLLEYNFDFSKDLNIPINGILRFSDEEGITNDFDEIYLDKENREYVFRLNSGRLWGNFETSNAKVNILVGNAVIIPDNSRFDLKFVDGKLEMATYNGDNYLAFLREDFKEIDFADEYADRYMNVLLVARDSQVKLTVSKISTDFAKLLPQKLSKTMDLFAAISASMKEESFVVQNNLKDLEFAENIKSKIRNEFSSEDYKTASTLVGSFLNLFKNNLTLIKDKNVRVKSQIAYDYLNQAIYFAVNLKSAELKSSLVDFDLYVRENNLYSNEDFLKVFGAYLDLLSVFKSRDLEYAVFEHFMNQSELDIGKAFDTLAVLKRNVYNSMDYSETLAKESLIKYFSYFEKVKTLLRKDLRFSKYLNYQNQIMDNFLYRSPLFYEDLFFSIKRNLEMDLLEIIGDDYLYTEMLQTFVSIKIDFLNRTWVYLKNAKINTEAAAKIYDRLFSEIKEILSNEKLSDVAVLDLFKKQLESLSDQYAYLKNVQYNTSSLYGSGHEERFAAYMKDRQFVPNLNEILFEDNATFENLDTIKSDLLKFFSDNLVSNVILSSFEDVNQRFVKINASIGGYDFEAEFDRYSLFLKNIIAYEETVSESAVKITNLESLLSRKFADKAPLIIDNPDAEIESHAQRVAKNFILQKISAEGFTLELENIKIANTDSSVFRVSDITFSDNRDLTISFDFVSSDEKLRNLYLIYDDKPVLLDGPYSIVEMKTMLLDKVDFEALANTVLDFDSSTEETSDRVAR